MPSLALIFALAEEARAVLEAEALSWEPVEGIAQGGGFGAWKSRAWPLSLCVCGVGKAYASWAYALMAPGYDAVLSLGTSGGLSDEAIGSAWFCDEFVEHDMDVSPMGFPPGVTPFGPLKESVIRTGSPWLDDLCSATLGGAGIPFGRCRVMAGDEFMADAARSAAKRELHGARLADMETAAMAKLAASRSSKPFMALRVVSDNANHESALKWEENLDLASRLFASFALALGPRLAGEG